MRGQSRPPTKFLTHTLPVPFGRSLGRTPGAEPQAARQLLEELSGTAGSSSRWPLPTRAGWGSRFRSEGSDRRSPAQTPPTPIPLSRRHSEATLRPVLSNFSHSARAPEGTSHVPRSEDPCSRAPG